jgi:hypothetical protein
MFGGYMLLIGLQADKPHGDCARAIEPGTHSERQHRIE